MRDLVLPKVELGLRRAVPMATALLCVFIDLLPVPHGGPEAAAPHLALIAVVHWTLYRADLIAPSGIFLLGLVRDLLADLPLGMHSLALLMVPIVLRNAPLTAVARAPVTAWAVFGLVALIVATVRWLVGAFMWGAVLPIRPFMLETALTFAVYPLVSWLLAQLHVLLVRVPRVPGS